MKLLRIDKYRSVLLWLNEPYFLLFIKMKICIILLTLVWFTLAVSPPIFNYAFHISFDEAVTVDKTVYRVNGQMFYDPKNNKERIDRANGRYNRFCGTVLPNVTTPCLQISAENKRWIIFPQRSQCCFCCEGNS